MRPWESCQVIVEACMVCLCCIQLKNFIIYQCDKTRTYYDSQLIIFHLTGLPQDLIHLAFGSGRSSDIPNPWDECNIVQWSWYICYNVLAWMRIPMLRRYFQDGWLTCSQEQSLKLAKLPG